MTTFEDVIRAGRVLFGPGFLAESAGWRDALRTTYRRRAMETHPDRARALGRPESVLAREFEAVANAYRVLSALRAGPLPAPARSPSGARGTRRAPPSPGPPPRAGRAASPAANASRGPRVRVGTRPEDLPRRRLRFAEYLYYSGHVRWSELVDALAWQRAQRPPVGRIAVEFGFLGPDDVGLILERRREAGAHAVPFGEWAVRLGYLTPFQLLAVLGQQLRTQRRIGEWFVARGLLDEDDVDGIRRRILRHNSRQG